MIIHNNSLYELKKITKNSIDAIVTDPPYELGFMGKSWDKTGIANNVEMWAECLRVLKPGGHLLSFGGTRTYHRMAVAIEDAGFEVRDMIEWVYGSGFPKSLNIGKAVDKRGGTTSDQSKEFAEYIKNRRNELNITLSKADEVICGGTTNYSWFEGRPAGQRLPRKADYLKMKELLQLDDRYDSFMEETERELIAIKDSLALPINDQLKGWGEKKEYKVTKGTSEWEGWGTALKPAHEPICMARKPLAEKTVAENCLKWGTGGINIDESRVGIDGATKRSKQAEYPKNENGTEDRSGSWARTGHEVEELNLGRFPANLIHDNSDEVKMCFPNESERFFKSIIYQAKASKSERNKGTNNFHATVKPVALMEYLIRMVTPKGGVVLDPFMGSGSTGVAAKNLGIDFVGIELEEDYIEIAKKRII